MKAEFIAFTERGLQQARRLALCLPEGAQVRVARGFGPGKEALSAWVERAFAEADALVFVGAAGIAVRAIAPRAASKAKDPAVIVADEAGRWVIPLLSGHIGGANRLARLLALGTGAQAVLTTATDVRGVWAVDDWAVSHGMVVANPERIKGVSSRLLAGGRVRLACELPLEGRPPAGVDVIDAGGVSAGFPAPDVAVSPYDRPCKDEALRIVPRRVVVGVGCRRGASEESLGKAIDGALALARVLPSAVKEVRSIDLKRDEQGLLGLARHRGWPLRFFSSDELAAVPGDFPASAFVERVAGVDNVCERAAAAQGEAVILPKTIIEGAAVAVSLDECPIRWNEE